uniref:Uncharacterized protein n=1 Tax=Thermogemmatispora argillosa TaxID=2045280 RepID=A0A455T293_9CHLR|nr:hypothetical protein KTA_15410 [Thermogemmatispora argillosa]
MVQCSLTTLHQSFSLRFELAASPAETADVPSPLWLRLLLYPHPAFRSFSLQTPWTPCSLPALHQLPAYLERHLTLLHADPDSESPPLQANDLPFRLQAFAADLAPTPSGSRSFAIRILLQTGFSSHWSCPVFAGGEETLALSSLTQFLSCWQQALDALPTLLPPPPSPSRSLSSSYLGPAQPPSALLQGLPPQSFTLSLPTEGYTFLLSLWPLPTTRSYLGLQFAIALPCSTGRWWLHERASSFPAADLFSLADYLEHHLYQWQRDPSFISPEWISSELDLLVQAQGGQRLQDGSGAVQLLCLPLFCSKTDKQTIRLGGLAPVDRAVLQDFIASLRLSLEQLGAINDPSALY